MAEKKTEKTQLSETKREQINQQPILESAVRLSEDKKWVIHRTIITDIKPATYWSKVMDGKKE